MRSFAVRISLLLAFVLVVIVVFVWKCAAGVSGRDDPSQPPARARVVTSLPPRVTRIASPEAAPADPVALLMRDYANEIDSLDQETSGVFSWSLRRVLSDPDRSVELGAFRIPAREGMSDVLATIPGEIVDVKDDHDRRLLVIAAAAIVSGETEEDRIRNVGFLAERYQLLSSRQ